MAGWHRRPLTDLERVLGHRVSEQEQEYFDLDVGKSGHTLAGHNYEGPGNSLNNGEVVDNSDEFARRHDYEYFDTQWRYNEGQISQEEAEREVRKEDREAISGFEYEAEHGERLAGTLGAWGLGIKNQFEDLFGHKYPDFPDAPQKHKYILPKGETHIANEEEVDKQERPMKRVIESTPKKNKVRVYPTTPTNNSTLPEASLPSGSNTIDPAQVPLPADNFEEDIEMVLTGTGKEIASGGASSDGMATYTIERPLSIFGNKISTYKKSHKFMTFGFASNTIIESIPNQDAFMSTYLAEIPWHIPALYLNQSEFDLLPVSARVKSVSIDVIYRGSTIQFETAQTATGLATLNQINDIGFAHGLNRTGWGSNVRFGSFSATQPMIPDSVNKPIYQPIAGIYRGMVRDYYGSNNNSVTFQGDVPKHQVARQTFLYNYWAMSTRGNTATPAQAMFGGWPCLAEKIEQMDGKTCVNQVITSSTYSPKFAPIKPPLRSQGHGLPWPAQNNTISVPGLGDMINRRQANIAIANVVPSNGGIQATSTEASAANANTVAVEPVFNIYTPIEKSQYGQSGYWGIPGGHIQPSIHVGVQPVPALSSAALLIEDGQFNNWTDTRAYWEVVATMVVEDHQPTAFPYAAVPNVPLGENVVWAPAANRPVALTDAQNDGATFCGLYTLSAAPV
nr:MAG: capsid protein [Chemarfal virus 36]